MHIVEHSATELSGVQKLLDKEIRVQTQGSVTKKRPSFIKLITVNNRKRRETCFLSVYEYNDKT